MIVFRFFTLFLNEIFIEKLKRSKVDYKKSKKSNETNDRKYSGSKYSESKFSESRQSDSRNSGSRYSDSNYSDSKDPREFRPNSERTSFDRKKSDFAKGNDRTFADKKFDKYNDRSGSRSNDRTSDRSSDRSSDRTFARKDSDKYPSERSRSDKFQSDKFQSDKLDRDKFSKSRENNNREYTNFENEKKSPTREAREKFYATKENVKTNKFAENEIDQEIVNKAYIYGRNSVIEALHANEKIAKIYIVFGAQGAPIDKILFLARKAEVQVVKHDKNKFAKLENTVCGDSAKSQGVIALLEMTETVELEEILIPKMENGGHSILIALDEIEDPHNLGAIARSAVCAGVQGMILPERNSAQITPATIKTSAGAIEHIKISRVPNLGLAIDKAKEAGFWIVGAEADGEHFYSDNIYDKAILLVIGSEGKGIRPSIRKKCDYLVKIPLKGAVNSLNASVSAGILLFEIQRQQLLILENANK